MDDLQVSICKVILGVALLGSWLGKDSQASQNPVPSATVFKVPSLLQAGIPMPGFDPAQHQRADSILSVFENSTPDIQYDYVEALGDGRGITAGRGFTTGTGDLLAAVELYTMRVPDNVLATYLPRLREIAAKGDGTTSGLDGLTEAWKKAAQDQVFRSVQDEIVDRTVYQPAVKHWQDQGCATPIALLVIYDTVLQHGNGKDPDGAPAIVARTNTAMGGPPSQDVPEMDWVEKLLEVRKDVLMNATDEETRDQWRESVDRCNALQELLKSGNTDLKQGLSFHVWDREWKIS